MSKLCLNVRPVGDVPSGLGEIIREWPHRFFEAGEPIEFVQDPGFRGLRIERVPGQIKVRYGAVRDAYRSVGILLGESEDFLLTPFEESAPFSHLGVMLDVSRNAVLHLDKVQFYLRRFALMGINSVQLYMEDVYDLVDEPFFGYGRGGYTPDDLRRLDAYASELGIELIPCVQTLGHLEQILQWPAYADIMDVPGVLLIGDERVYALIRKMLETLSGCFQSRRIHIGMDEAHGVGLGKYRKLHGECRPFDILNQHLAVVTEVCESLGLLPMMWSDMYFRIGSPINDYYDPEAKIPQDVPGRIPRNVDLVYWDYYHTEQSFYEEWIDRHRAMGKNPIFASGGWNWGRLWTRFDAGFPRVAAGMRAAREKSLSEAFVTLWGDDGAECDPFSVLPSIQYFVECAYGHTPTEGHLGRRFDGSCGASLEPLLLGSKLDAFPDDVDPETSANFSKWILWHDPVLNFLAPCIPDRMAEHYQQLAIKFSGFPINEKGVHVEFAEVLSRVLAGKTRLHQEVRDAYQIKDVKLLAQLKEEVLVKVIDDLQELWEIHRQIWHSWYRPFGWEVLDRRYGGLSGRLKSLDGILGRCLSNPETRVPEFEFTLRKTNPSIFFNFARTSFPTTWR